MDTPPSNTRPGSRAFAKIAPFNDWTLPRRLGASALAVLIAAVFCALFLSKFRGHFVYITVIPAVAVAAVVGGAPGGVLAAVLAAIAAHFFMAPLSAEANLLGLVCFFSSSGVIIGVIGLLRSTQTQLANARVIQQSEQQLGQFIEQAPVAMAMFDCDMRYLAASARWREDYNLRRDVVGKSHYDVFPELDERWKEINRRGLAGETIRAEEDLFTRPDGSTQWLRWEVRPWRRCPEEIGGIIIFSEDVTQSVLARRALVDGQRRLRAVFETAMDAIIVIDDVGTILSVNPEAQTQFGYAPIEMIGQNITMLMSAHFQTRHEKHFAGDTHIRESGIIGKRRRFDGRRKNGEIFPLELAVGKADVAEAPFFVGFVRDLSEIVVEKRLKDAARAELMHVSRLSDMGEVAAGLAHEVAQPVTAIMVYAATGRRALAFEPASPVAKTMCNIEAQAIRAGEILKRLRRFVEKRETQRSPENLNHLIEEALALAQMQSNGRPVRQILTLSSEDIEVNVDRVQIQQVLVNFLRNAADAMADHADPVVGVAAYVARPGFARVQVSDWGPGVDPGVADRLFTPFTTTKSAGMGIGLSLCKTIVADHDGEIGFDPNAPHGAIFWFTLPIVGSGGDEAAAVQ